MTTVASFVEESCWDGETFKSVRREVVFKIRCHKLRDRCGKPLLHEFRADYGIFFDVEDSWLIQILKEEIPNIAWDWYVYHKSLDHSGITVFHPESGDVLGRIESRGQTQQKLSCEILGGNIVPISKGYEYRAERVAREEKRSRRKREEDRQSVRGAGDDDAPIDGC